MRKLAFVLVVAACGGSDHHQQVVVVDAPIDTAPDAPPVQPTQIALDVFPTPQFIAYRDGQGAWQTPTADSMGRYALTVRVDYQAVVVCANATSSYAELLEATAGDGDQFVFCNGGVDSMPPTTVAMTGHMVQPGQVFLGDGASSTTGPWDFTVNVPTGMHDLIATSTTNSIVIRRNQNITAAGALSPIDTTSEGSAMTAVPLTINGAGSDMLLTGYDLFLGHDGAFWSGSSSTVYVPPASLLTSNDFKIVFVEAYTQTSARFGEVQFNGTQTTFDLPAALTGVVFGPAKASFGTLSTYDTFTLDLAQSGVEQEILATKGWVDATQATSLAFDAAPPDFNSAWNINTGAAYDARFEATYGQGGIDYGNIVFEHAPLQREASLLKFSTVARLRESMRSQHTMPRR
jgi:hypothetical protein